ncbi:3-galactosyl-N-acetylglucosaminide 4-alpha-L-fucosyltransferase FUT3-like [Clavelina lepadiformis]|uniref:3-galactosyl-N-acetylglucosaminide 4-alpha-L-fucosyltransferase FUT3-like n=1 Tax=Clavelina lepadiformis TaxID=159417 RepID=UPI0040419C8C
MRSLKGQNLKNTLKYHNFRHLKPSVGNSLAVWAVSDCNKTDGARKRMKLVEDLMQAGLEVDRYGACFHRRQTYINFNLYKFYLAFENSYHCRDYVTEKFWFNSVKNLLVPVIWDPAKEDLEDLVPKGSYIFVEDFASPADLVKYLIYLDNNVAAYLEYFRWLKDPELLPNYMKQQSRIDYLGFEELCQKARANTETKVINDIAEYVFGTEREECLVSEEERQTSD